MIDFDSHKIYTHPLLPEQLQLAHKVRFQQRRFDEGNVISFKMTWKMKIIQHTVSEDNLFRDQMMLHRRHRLLRTPQHAILFSIFRALDFIELRKWYVFDECSRIVGDELENYQSRYG